MMIKIIPDGDGWSWAGDDGETHRCEDRKTAIEEGRKAAGIKVYDLTDPESREVAGQHRTEANEPVLLYREDGTLYGELNAGPSQAEGEPQRVDLEPVSTREGTG